MRGGTRLTSAARCAKAPPVLRTLRPGFSNAGDRPNSSVYALFKAAIVLTTTVSAWGQYPTYSQIETTLLTAEQNYPGFAKRYSIGTTVQGRTMWFLRISDNVLVEEDEPEVAYISTMHGDEVTGVVMSLNLIDYLLSNYGSDSRVTDLVNSVELWINPCMNPDGYTLHQR